VNNLSLIVVLATLLHLGAGAGCAETTVTFLTQAPPGRTATVDVETETLTLTRGLAVAFECVEWTEGYAGPCRDMSVSFGDDTIGEHVRAHLDALAGQTAHSRQQGFDDAQTVGGPTDRQGGVVLALAEGTTALTIGTAGAPVAMTLDVTAPPAPPEPEAEPEDEPDDAAEP
jgi:hypothetical protein